MLVIKFLAIYANFIFQYYKAGEFIVWIIKHR